MKNMCSMGLLRMWQWSVKDGSYTVTRPALSTGEGLRTFRWNVVLSSWTVDPEGEGKLISRQGKKSQMTWSFTNNAVRISQPQTVVPKRRQETTDRPAASITLMIEVAGNLKCWCVSARLHGATTENINGVRSVWWAKDKYQHLLHLYPQKIMLHSKH